MCRKVIGGVLGVMLLAWFFVGRDAASYIGTAVNKIKATAKDTVPVEFEIDRARQMVKDLTPEIQKNMQVIAKEEVQVERMQKQIQESEDGLAKNKGDLLRLKSDLAANKTSYSYGGRVFTVAQVKDDLANRFDRYKTSEATLGSLKGVLQAREKGLDAAKQKLEAMLAAKRKLDVEVENLDARLKAVEVAQTSSEQNFDDSQLGRVKELITDLRCRLDVSAKMVDAQSQIKEAIPLDTPDQGNIADRVSEYFGDSAQKVADAGQK
ncbi:MAG TPA: hypothetical protein VFE24_12350 [Pirellulales bacterium]|jgi:chromosome segregation ATPase|nr:hypothetical protein [Pirellulales bacterium]